MIDLTQRHLKHLASSLCEPFHRAYEPQTQDEQRGIIILFAKKYKHMKKIALIGCGTITVIFFILLLIGGIWLFTGPDGGVRLPHEMEQYALVYLEENQIIDESEELLAYYDVTVSLNSSIAAILTTKRVIYHNNGNNSSIDYTNIEDVNHRVEPVMGDIIEIVPASGPMMKIEIAMWNQGETFLNVLMNTWGKSKQNN